MADLIIVTSAVKTELTTPVLEWPSSADRIWRRRVTGKNRSHP
jgi:hypothetical protein